MKAESQLKVIYCSACISMIHLLTAVVITLSQRDVPVAEVG